MPIKFMKHIWLWTLLLLGQMSLLQAQIPGEPDTTRETIKILNSQRLKVVTIDGRSIQKLIGEVVVQHDSTLFFCDSLYLYEDSNSLEAFSRVRVEMPDSVFMLCDRMEYDGNTKIADAYDNILLSDNEARLETDLLAYNRALEYGEYKQGGVLYDGEDTLTSKYGIYYPQQDMAYFSDSVLLRSPETTLETDTLGYNTETRVAVFMAPTRIVSPDGEIVTSKGEYDTQARRAILDSRTQVTNEDYILTGNKLDFDNESETGYAEGDVILQQTDSSLEIRGQIFNRKPQESFVTKQAVAIQYFKDDTLYIRGDTLYALEDSQENRTFKAYYRVHFFMGQMQGQADSMVYHYGDSLMELYGDPVLWADSSQLSGDTIRVYMKNEQIDSMVIDRNSFVVSQEDTVGFNQIKGRQLLANFKENELRKIHVTGNSESIYFIKDDAKGTYEGMNKAISQEMFIYVENNQTKKVVFIAEPEGSYRPFYEVMFDENRLDGMTWRIEERPPQPDSPLAFVMYYDSIYAAEDFLLDSLRRIQDSLVIDSTSTDTLLQDSTMMDSANHSEDAGQPAPDKEPDEEPPALPNEGEQGVMREDP
ncbi:MAG: OstA-like protein [Bacteroidota bacterium]